MLIKGKDLNEKQLREVQSAFIYRWTIENAGVERLYVMCGAGAVRHSGATMPTMDKVTDKEWIESHAFHFLKDGSRLSQKKQNAEPVYMADGGDK